MERDQARDSESAWLDCQAVEAWIGGQCVVQDLTLKLLKGESTAVLGPNGAGKSTLSYVLTGRDGYEVTGGSALLNGESILEMERHCPGLLDRTVRPGRSFSAGGVFGF